MDLRDMARKMAQRSFRTTQNASAPVKAPLIRTGACDMLTELERAVESEEINEGALNHESIRSAIEERYGTSEAEKYEPGVNVKSRTKWLHEGYLIQPGEVALCFVHMVNGKKVRTVAMYHKKQMRLGT